MSSVQVNSPAAGDSAASETIISVKKEQALRLQRLSMAFLSHMVTGGLVVLCWYIGLIPGLVVLQYGVFVALITGFFWAMIASGLNLRLPEPSMTRPQMITSILPALWVMYFVDSGQVRASFMLIAVVPALYGILALNIRQFLVVGFFYVALYGAMIGVIWWNRPEVLDGPLEVFQLLALLVVMMEIAVIGGFIHSLRAKLRVRNLELQEAMAKISEMAHRDPLTGLFNRRHLFDVLSREANRQRRAQGPFSLCIMDVDHFKAVNDTYGHQAGDTILKQIAESAGQSMRNIDCFGRYGGEEFLLVLPQTDIRGAMIKAERVRAAVEALRFPSIAGDFRVTVSVGVAEYQGEETPEHTLNRADAALYQAKAAGRNRVVRASAAMANAR